MTNTLAAYKARTTALTPLRANILSTIAVNNAGLNYFWDFLNGLEGWVATTSGGGSVYPDATNNSNYFSSQYLPGEIRLEVTSSGATAGITCSALSASTLSMDTAYSTSITFQANLGYDGLNLASTSNSAGYFGLIDGGGLVAGFEFDGNVSNYWRCVLPGVTTHTTSNLVAGHLMHVFKVYLTTTNAYFYIDNVLVYSSAFTPQTGNDLLLGANITKNTSGVISSILVDAVSLSQEFVTTRAFT